MNIHVYIAGPYTNPDPVVNTKNVIRVADFLMTLGFIPFVPHLSLFWHFLFAHEIDYWYKYDLAWVDKCDCLLRLNGESSGADAEVAYAKEHQIPVYYSVKELVKQYVLQL